MASCGAGGRGEPRPRSAAAGRWRGARRPWAGVGARRGRNAMVEGGAVLSCGEGSNGRLGHGDGLKQLTPKTVAAVAGQRVVQVAAGVAP